MGPAIFEAWDTPPLDAKPHFVKNGLWGVLKRWGHFCNRHKAFDVQVFLLPLSSSHPVSPPFRYLQTLTSPPRRPF